MATLAGSVQPFLRRGITDWRSVTTHMTINHGIAAGDRFASGENERSTLFAS